MKNTLLASAALVCATLCAGERGIFGLYGDTPRSGVACTRRAFGDAQFHVEWLSPVADAKKHGQLGGNSGVIPMGRYEIQILNSYDRISSA